MWYFIKRPNKKRRSFAIYSQVELPDGSTKNKTLKNKDVEAINKNLSAGIVDLVTAEKNVKKIIEQLYIKDRKLKLKAVDQPDNYRILDEYWEREYAHRDLVDPKSAYAALRRAVDAVGELPLLSASREALQAKINSQFKGAKQRRIIERLLQLLKFINRTDVKLRKDKLPREKVKYLSESQFTKAIKQIKDPAIKILFQVCFYSGVRIGEAFAILEKPRNSYIKVITQIDREGIERDTKTRSEREVFVFKNGHDALAAWITCKQDIRWSRSTISKYARIILREYGCKFHDLRHSYAIMLLAKGVPIQLVAQSLGNSVTVCERYYAGFQLTSVGMETIRRLVKED